MFIKSLENKKIEKYIRFFKMEILKNRIFLKKNKKINLKFKVDDILNRINVCYYNRARSS